MPPTDEPPTAGPTTDDAGRPSATAGRRSYAVVGLGAVGGLYGARLAAAGHPVHFVVRSDLDHVRRHGLLVETPEGDVRLDEVAAWPSAADVPPVDVVVLATKTSVGVDVAELLGPMVRPGTIVVAMQNGLGVEAPLAAAFPEATVLGAMCFVCSNKVGPGHIRHLDYGQVTVGEHSAAAGGAGVTAAVEAVAGDLEAAGLPVVRIADLGTGRWRKLVWNIPFNGLSVVLDAGTDELMADPATRALVRALMEEVLAGAAACGHPIEAGFVDHMLATTDAMTPYKTSMKLDHEAGRPMEIDAIYGAPTTAARRAGAPMVRAETVYAQLQLLDRRNRQR